MSDSMLKRRRDFGARLAARREELRLTQEEIAARVGISQAHVWKYEHGAVKSHTPEEFAAFARALEVSPAEIASWAEYGVDTVGADRQNDKYAHLGLPPNVTDGELRLLRYLFQGIRLYEEEGAAVVSADGVLRASDAESSPVEAGALVEDRRRAQ